MKLIHLSDLHLGKRVNEFPMLEDQKYILTKILNVIDEEKPDGILIAGDIYDKSVPSAEAVELFDDFLVRIAKRRIETFIISGNHDSPERLAFANRLIDVSGIHLSPVYDGNVKSFPLTDENGTVNIYMLPFIKPVHVRRFFPEEEITSYTDAVAVAIRQMNPDFSERNVLMTHQFVTGAERSDSEDLSVGGSDNVDGAVFEGWDYVALGHLHGPQNVSDERIRYCGTPLKYSFSEVLHKKSVSVVELGAKGQLTVRCVPLEPMRDLVEIKGKFAELTDRSFYEGTTYQNDYIHVTLTDEDDIPEVISKVRLVYPYLMKLDYDNQRTRHTAEISEAADVDNKQPFELFAEFYEQQNGKPMSEEQAAFMQDLIEKVWEENR